MTKKAANMASTTIRKIRYGLLVMPAMLSGSPAASKVKAKALRRGLTSLWIVEEQTEPLPEDRVIVAGRVRATIKERFARGGEMPMKRLSLVVRAFTLVFAFCFAGGARVVLPAQTPAPIPDPAKAHTQVAVDAKILD